MDTVQSHFAQFGNIKKSAPLQQAQPFKQQDWDLCHSEQTRRNEVGIM